MLPAYSYTEYVSPSGNTQIYIVKQRKHVLKLSERQKYIVKQKLLGTGMIVLGIVGCLLFPEDCSGAMLACFMGVIRVVFQEDEYNNGS